MTEATCSLKCSGTKSACISLLLLGVAVTSSGCNSAGANPNLPQVSEVEGEVTYQGKPLPEVYVTFHPVDSDYSGTGQTDAEGHFSISTFAKDDGAVLGKHAVTIQRFELGAVPGVATKSDGSLSAKYATEDKTPITAEVVAGENHFQFAVD